MTGRPGDDHYDAKITVLGEYINHHVKEEEGEMFPKARKEGRHGRAGQEARRAEGAADGGNGARGGRR
jgi:hypothetical protein